MRMILLGTIPGLARNPVLCLSGQPDDVQRCSTPTRLAEPSNARIDRATAQADGVDYVDTVPWFCSRTCTPVIGRYEVYDVSGDHVSTVWADYLQNVFARALGLHAPSP
jgi:hypothetical protein